MALTELAVAFGLGVLTGLCAALGLLLWLTLPRCPLGQNGPVSPP